MKTTWEDLVAIEPGLGDLLKRAQAVKDPGGDSFCANVIWYRPGGFRNSLDDLVGWHAKKRDPVLNTSEGYDLAYDKVYDALPDCRNCLCLT